MIEERKRQQETETLEKELRLRRFYDNRKRMAEERHEDQNDDLEEPEGEEEKNTDGYKTVGDTDKRIRKAKKKKGKGKGKKKKEEKEVYQTPISSPLHSGEDPQSDSTNTIHPGSSSLESDEDDDDDPNTESNDGQDDDNSPMTISPSYPDCAQPHLTTPRPGRSQTFKTLVRFGERGGG